MSAPTRIRVLVVDDQRMFREGVVHLLKSDERISVVGEAEDGIEALKLVAGLRPDVVLMDVRMPRLDGISATRRIAAHQPSVHVLMLASVETDESVVEAMRAGAVGYVIKDSSHDALVRAIERAASGTSVLTSAGQRAVITSAVGKASRPRPAGLTSRQLQILRLMARGETFKKVASDLGLAEKTVRNQASMMYARLKVGDRAQAILFAVHKGLVA